jgi:hypothetical protein
VFKRRRRRWGGRKKKEKKGSHFNTAFQTGDKTATETPT